MLRAQLTSIFKIHAGEGRLVLLLMALMLLPAAGAAFGLSSAESLFLSRVGAEFLPRLYVILGLVTIATTLSITAFLGRISPLQFYLVLPIVLALLLVGARLLVGTGLGWVFGLLWIATVLFDTLQHMQVWGLAGMAFDTRQAKRLLPLVGAAGILGLALGGLVTRPLVRLLGTENLLLVWAALMLAAFGLTNVLTRDLAVKPSRSRRRTRIADDLQAGLQYVRSSQLMRWIAVAAVLFYVVFFLLGFQFSKAVAEQYPVEDTMTGFLGGFRGLTTAVALAISLFAANRYYNRFGIIVGVLTLTVFDLVGFSLLAVSATFLAIVGFRFVHESWLGGVTRTAWYAQFNIVPSSRREQTRMFINGVCLQAGVVLVGAMLLVGNQVLSERQWYLFGAAAAALTLFATWRARKAYLGALVDALRAGRPQVFVSEENPYGRCEHDASAIEIAQSSLSDRDPAVRRAAAEVLGDLSAAGATEFLVSALDDPDRQVRAAVLRALVSAKPTLALSDLTTSLKDPEPEVRLEAVHAVRQISQDHTEIVLHVQPLLDDPDGQVRAQAAGALLSSGPHAQAAQVLQGMIACDDPEVRVEALQGYGSWGDAEAYEPAATALEDAAPAVRRAAAEALAQIDHPGCPEKLARALQDDDRLVREAVASAIGDIGSPALQPTVKALAEPALEEGALMALERLPAHQEADAIRAHAKDEITRALRYYGLMQEAESSEGAGKEREQLLIRSLHIVAERHGIHALSAFALLNDRDAIKLAIDNLTGSNPDQRANAVEVLDSVADREAIRPLLALWERTSDSPTRADAVGTAGPAPDGWLLHLLRDPDPWLRACATFVAGDFDGESMRSELVQLEQNDPDPTVREAAAAALNGGNSMQTLPTLSLMERILFLRRVPLFTDLPPAELKQVATIAEEFLFVDGETIAYQDDPGDELYIIVTGEVQVMTSVDDEKKLELAQRKSGEYVGEMAIISREPRMASLVASGQVRTLTIGQKQFEGILRERPEISLAVMRVLCDRLREREDVPTRP